MDDKVDANFEFIESNSLINTENNFKVEAGPGAGKTTWLVNHIKNVLNKSTRLKKSKKVACITYTKIGVKAIINKLKDAGDQVEVSTIHSFLYKYIIKPYIYLIKDDYNLNIEKLNVYDESIFSYRKMVEWIKSGGVKLRYLLKDGKLTQQNLVNLCWTLEDDDCILKVRKHRNYYKRYDDGSKKMSFILDFSKHQEDYLKYKEQYWKDGIITYDDVLFFSYKLIKEYPQILKILRARFPYFFIDEFQDTNPIQAEIIRLLGGKETIVGIIGDKAQAIYEFQGADVTQFEKFTLDNMKQYKIKDNRRSTQQIIDILNIIRSDLKQESPDHKKGNKPYIIVGEQLNSYKKAKEIIKNKNENLYSLSYADVTSNEMKLNDDEIEVDESVLKDNIIDTILSRESRNSRSKQIVKIIKAIEYARQNNFKEAVKNMAKIYGVEKDIENIKKSLIALNNLLSTYDKFKNVTITKFYNKLKDSIGIDIRKISKGNIKIFYDSIKYTDVALWIKINEDNSIHRTIHKAKGDEFDNVIVIVKGKINKPFDENEDLAFLLNPDLSQESQRVYYVAVSRARENLFINVPELSSDNAKKLESYGFNIAYT
ncbi:UvrD-helicase domain-containing protein [Clostridium coskatii]|jgi:DNA helicase-2/ATP-dependent DNA helicase PcrA|uniref:DNA 3'-5' helicase n=1 Tax=Clostridium coskatii TaxID=1705578 RepID=A0A168MSB7_9CLOT|nr:ATP-dependent helicase [Clostridium coskatii]OAA85097.1 putative ATP-dependent DNA helicase YjcD [Clostridium coskatii]OBR90253.1 putative ATP-dependent DNA helicase YjcD [Clostridium coskatii]